MEAIFFPRKDYDVDICPIRYDKDMVYTEQTDGQHNTQSDHAYQWLVPLAKERGLKVGIFTQVNVGPLDNTGGFKDDYENGDIWLDVYSLTPNLVEYISPSGTHYGETITQEMYDEAYNNFMLPVFYAFTGKKPVAMSYSYGNDTFKDYTTQFLGCRNSGKGSDSIGYPTDYGYGYGNPNNKAYSFNNYKSRISTTRWYDTEKVVANPDWDAAIAAQRSLIRTTKTNKGWLNNFTHWHNVVNDGRQAIYVDYLDMLAEEKTNEYGDIWFAGYGEAIAYMVYRDMITRAVMYSPVLDPTHKLVIQMETSNAVFGIDTDLLQVPISVKFSTVGTPAEGKTITSNCNLINLGGGEYIVEIPFSRFPKAIINF